MKANLLTIIVTFTDDRYFVIHNVPHKKHIKLQNAAKKDKDLGNNLKNLECLHSTFQTRNCYQEFKQI